MPWNCLCSSEKQRHKLEISAPILNRDDKRRAKIIQNPTKDDNCQRNNNHETDIASTNNNSDDNKQRSKSSSKEKQRSKKTTKHAKDSHAQFQSGEEQRGTVKFSTDTVDLNLNASPQAQRVEHDEEDTTYSQLIFERRVNKPNEPSSINVLPPSKPVQRNDSNTGHYDRLPFDKSSKQSVPGNASFQHLKTTRLSVFSERDRDSQEQPYPQNKQNGTSTTGVGVPHSDAIPFIDEEDVVKIVEKHGTHLRISERNNNEYATTTRIITLHPKNIGSSQTIQRANTFKPTQLSNKSDASSSFIKRKNHVDENVEMVQRTNATGSVANQSGRLVGVHEFFSWNPTKGKLCQICHASALNGSNTVVKCSSCDLVCHLWCVPKIMPSVRYHDTSFIIYRKWLRGEDELAFPTIHKYALTSTKAEDSITKPDYYLTDSECTYSNGAEKRIDLDAVNRNKRKSRRRTRSLEKRKPTATNSEDNVIERFIVTSPNEGKQTSSEFPSHAGDNKIRIQVTGNDDNPKDPKYQSELDTLLIIENERKEGSIAATNTAETSDESDDFGSRTSCYDATKSKEHAKSQSEGDLIAVDVHLRPNTGSNRNSGLIITEPSDQKRTKEIVPAVPEISDKHNIRKVLVQRQISYTSDESASESQSPAKFYADGRTSSLRSSVRSTTSGASSAYSTSDLADDVTSLGSSSTLQKTNEDRVDSSQQILPKLETQPWPIQAQPTPSSQLQKSPPSLRLHYVTERILAYILPAQNGNHLGAHSQYEREVIPMLEQKHGKNYQLFNLETCISVITLERICEICKHIDKWLSSGQEKVVVLQDREDCQRLGATIFAFLEYVRICASNYQTRNISLNEDAQAQNTIARNWMNLDMFSMKKFLEGNIEPLRIPSYKRYIRYFSGLLSGHIKLNASALHLNYISIESPPSWLQYNGMSSNSEWSSFIKIYEGLQCVYTSDIHIIPITTRQFLYQIGNLRLRGDILIRCYQIGSSNGGYSRESKKLLFSVQFHTCAIKSDDVVFAKEDLDIAHQDSRFPNDCKVSFHFNSGSNNNNYLFQSPLIRTERLNDIAKSSSIENLDLRPAPACSVSPSSLPSQVSPQEDRHRELDDILSDMLLTVQDIPDFQNRKTSTHSINQYSRSQSVVSHVSAAASAPSPVYTLPIPNPPTHSANREAVHSSHSYVSQDAVQRNSNSNSYKQDRFDPYDTASTTTTLTPPPSESGRDTPNLFSGYHSSTSNISLGRQQQLRRDTSGTMSLQHGQVNPESAQSNSQHQSAIYQRTVRTSSSESHPIVVNASEDEENIPYHAREHSQPFTYGNLPSNGVHLNEVSGPESQQKDPRMIKAQSGLTSPMLVRKTFGSGSGGASSEQAMYSTLRKTSTRNEFEEMLRERREKVMSEKYSISDKQPVASNGYHNYYNDPLKRSNTLDGFHRSTSNTELGGQTWLQLQQQKLRAKKSQQQKDDRRHFEEINTEIKNRSLRSRNNVRYDGYASDTAAFDEVDYRRPLHVQTPYHTTNSSPERHYHTISTTTKTVTKERPFVSVIRSHEAAKQEKLGSPPLSPFAILNASPLGHIAQAQPGGNNVRNSNNNNNNSNSSNQNGLLSLADSSLNNGRARLESDNKTNVHTKTLKLGKANSNSHTNNLNTEVSSTHSNQVNADNNNLNEIHLKITDSKTAIDLNSTDLSNNYHNNNICYTSNNNESPYHANTEILSNHIHHEVSKTVANTSINGQVALEELLATLAVETDLMDQQLIQNKQQPSNGSVATRLKETGNEEKANQELSDVIADLAEFTRFENQRLANGFGDSLSNKSSDSSNGSNVNNAQKRLLSESDQSSSISPSPSDRSNNQTLWHEQVREESFSSYRSETDQDISIAGSPRPETPAFPVTPRTPYGLNNGSISPGIPPRSPTPHRRLHNSTWSLRSIKSTTSTLDRSSKDIYSGAQKGLFQEVSNQNDTIYRNRMNSTASNANSEPQEVAPHLVKFVRDSSKFWYKPNLSREEAFDLLRNAQPGTFIVRDSATFKDAYGLVVRVAQPPPGVAASPEGDELVRHFLVEPTTRGVRLKGCANEPVFTSLSALVYQHSITPLALSCRLIIPDSDIQPVEMHTPAQKQLLTQGAACNVLYLYSCGTESLTGEEAVRRAVAQLFSIIPLPKPTEVHFKVAQQGITLTDNTRQKFFRKHYGAQNISFCGIDPEHRQWSVKKEDGSLPVSNKTIFAFVARRSPSSKDNQCHVFCDLAVNQPATAIVSFANKVLPTEKQVNRNI